MTLKNFSGSWLLLLYIWFVSVKVIIDISMYSCFLFSFQVTNFSLFWTVLFVQISYYLTSFLYQCWASLIAQLAKNLPALQETWVRSRLGRSPGEGIGYPLQYSWASLVAQLVKNPPAVPETWVWQIPWRRERLPTPVLWPREFHGLYSPWVAKSCTRLRNFHFINVSFCCGFQLLLSFLFLLHGFHYNSIVNWAVIEKIVVC